MISEERVAEILAAARILDEAADALIDEANEAGGRDNITVVLFRLEEVGGDGAAGDDATMVGAGPVGATRPRRARADGVERASGARPRSPSRPRSTGVPAAVATAPRARRLQPIPASDPRARAEARDRHRRKHAAVRQAARGAVRGADRAGADRRRRLPGHPPAVLRRHQPAGHRDDLPRAARTTCRPGSACTRRSTSPACPARWCPPPRRDELLNNHLRSQSDATSLVMALEQGRISP